MTLREMIINTEKARLLKQINISRKDKEAAYYMRIARFRTYAAGGWSYQDCASCRGIFDKFYYFLYDVTNYEYNRLYEKMLDWDFTSDEELAKKYKKYGVEVDEIIGAFFANKFPQHFELLNAKEDSKGDKQ